MSPAHVAVVIRIRAERVPAFRERLRGPQTQSGGGGTHPVFHDTQDLTFYGVRVHCDA